MAKNEKCVISDSSVCRWINKECSNCYVDGMKTNEDKQKVLSDFEVMLSYLPDDFDILQGDECQFCKGKKKPRAAYAVIDLAHSEPEHSRGMFFGLGKKVRQRIGSLLPVNISVCKDCRRTLRMVDNIKWLSIVAFIGIAIGVLFIPGVSQQNSPLPYAIVILGGVAGYIIGKLLSAAYMKAKSGKVHFNVFNIPVCADMKELGWFTVQDEGPATRFIFTKKPFIRTLGDLKKKEHETDEDFTQTSFLED